MGEINRFLLQKKQEHRRVLLIIDEAQNLSDGTLEQVRLLSNLETSSSKLIHILLLGQPELDRKLDSADLRQLRQRISVRWALHPLSARETRDYVRHRLHVAAGAERDLFSDGALREVHRRTGGVPRLVNVLCDRALLAGYVARAPRISAKIVKQAAREIPDAARRSRGGAAGSAGGGRRLLRRLGVGSVFATLLAGAVAGGLVLASSDFARLHLEPLLAPLHSLVSIAGASLGSAPPTGALGPEVEVAAAPVDHGIDASASVAVDAAPPLEAKELRPVDPSRVDEMSRAALEGLAKGAFLASVVDAEDEERGRGDALNAILDAFGLPPFESPPTSDEMASLWLGDRGLATLEMDDGDFESLRSLNHPALMRVQGSDESQARLVALMRLEGDMAAVAGLSGQGEMWVPVDELQQQWDGEAWVVWNDFESVRPVLAFGEQGHSVNWLQEALAELGYYQGAVTGLFDRETREGLRQFQRIHQLQADGMAGPRTRMVLYDALGRYDVPRLYEPSEQTVTQ